MERPEVRLRGQKPPFHAWWLGSQARAAELIGLGKEGCVMRPGLSQQAHPRVSHSSLRLTQDTQGAPGTGDEMRVMGQDSLFPSVHGSRKSRTEGSGGPGHTRPG